MAAALTLGMCGVEPFASMFGFKSGGGGGGDEDPLGIVVAIVLIILLVVGLLVFL